MGEKRNSFMTDVMTCVFGPSRAATYPDAHAGSALCSFWNVHLRAGHTSMSGWLGNFDSPHMLWGR